MKSIIPLLKIIDNFLKKLPREDIKLNMAVEGWKQEDIDLVFEYYDAWRPRMVVTK